MTTRDIATTKRERELMEHALGIQMRAGRKTKEYRNYFTTVPESDMDNEWKSLVSKGCALCHRSDDTTNAYHVTDLGKAQL